VILYFVGRYFLYNKPPYFAAFLIPLFEYDPLQAKKDSFLQRLVWYKMNPIIEQAQKTFQASADSVKDIHVDFQAIAAKALEGK
jgi:hypothetical protein